MLCSIRPCAGTTRHLLVMKRVWRAHQRNHKRYRQSKRHHSSRGRCIVASPDKAPFPALCVLVSHPHSFPFKAAVRTFPQPVKLFCQWIGFCRTGKYTTNKASDSLHKPHQKHFKSLSKNEVIWHCFLACSLPAAPPTSGFQLRDCV